MRSVDVTLQGVQIIAIALDEKNSDLAVGHAENFELRQRRRFGARTHIDPDNAGALDGAIRPGADLVLEILIRQHVRHIEALAGHVKFPAVIDAAQSALLAAAEKQRGATMRAAMI